MKRRLSGSARRPHFRLACLSALLISTGAAAAAHDPDHYPCDHNHAAERPARGAADLSARRVAYEDDDLNGARYRDYGGDGRARSGAYDRTAYSGRSDLVSVGGIEAARRAHYLYDRSTAERLDGRCERIVRIAAGETLSDIAEFCDTPARAILQANPDIISPRTIRAGQSIYIPDAEGDIYAGARRRDRCAAECNSARAGRYDGERTTWSVRGDVVPLFGGSILEAAPLGDNGRTRDARIIAAGLQRYERVAIFAGEKRGAMRWVKMVEADRNGRVDEVVPLPRGDRFRDVQWAMQPEDGRVIYSAPYALGEAAYIDPLQ